MSVDASIVREAERLLAHFTTPARKLVEANVYGTLEARLAGAVVTLAQGKIVIEHSFTTETEQMAALKEELTGQISTLVGLLRRAATMIEDHVTGAESFVDEIDSAIDAAVHELALGEDETEGTCPPA